MAGRGRNGGSYPRWIAAVLALAGCERSVTPPPPPVPLLPAPAPEASASDAPPAPVAPAPPACPFVVLDGSLAFRDDLRWVAVSGPSEGGNEVPTFYAVALQGGVPARALKRTFEGTPYQREWTPDGKTLVTVVNFHTGLAEITLWDTATWAPRATVSAYCTYEASVSRDGTWIGAIGCNGDHMVMDTRRGAKDERWMSGPNRSAADTDIVAGQSPDSKSWVVADNGGSVELFRVHPLRHVKDVVKGDGLPGVTSTAFAADGHTFATATSDGAVSVWDSGTGALRRVVQGPRGKPGEHPTAVAFGPDGALSTVEVDGVVHLWDAASGAVKGTLGSPLPPVDPNQYPSARAAFLDKERISLCTRAVGREHLTVFDRASGKAIVERDTCGATSPDGARLLFDAGGSVEVVEAASGTVARKVSRSGAAERMEWIGGGRFAAWMEGTSGDGGFRGHLVHVLRIADGAELWMALLDGPGGPHLVARGSGGAYAGDVACLPGPKPPAGPAPDTPPSPKPELVEAFFAGP